MAKKPKKNGRPSKFSEKTADLICEKLATSSNGLDRVCADLKIAPSSVYLWLKDNTKFSEKYAHARERQADFLADEILDIADDATNDFMTIRKGNTTYEVENKEWTSRSKLRVEARQWKAGKLAPKVYGNKTTLAGDPDNPLNYIPVIQDDIK